MEPRPAININVVHEIPKSVHRGILFSRDFAHTPATATSNVRLIDYPMGLRMGVRAVWGRTKIYRPIDGTHHIPQVSHALFEHAMDQVVRRRSTELLRLPVVVFWAAKGRKTWEIHYSLSKIMGVCKQPSARFDYDQPVPVAAAN